MAKRCGKWGLIIKTPKIEVGILYWCSICPRLTFCEQKRSNCSSVFEPSTFRAILHSDRLFIETV